MPDPLHDGSKRLRERMWIRWSRMEILMHTTGTALPTYMWVTWEYLGSLGWTVRKSTFVATELRQPALASIDLSVWNRCLSLSKANSCGSVGISEFRSADHRDWAETNLSLVIHKGAEMGSFVPRCSSRIYYSSAVMPDVLSQNACWKTGCLVLEYNFSSLIHWVFKKTCIRGEKE